MTNRVKKILATRRRAYGHPAAEFARVAAMWSIILNSKVTAAHVGLCMICVKLAREVHSHKQDNLVDLCGYSACVEELYRRKKGKQR
ncbi:MAG: DUF6378 domain-containing protein [Planctomycetota bacterium]|nr:DUF6378 domain-containing protein [Planctomycetota bacterium]